MKDYQQILFPYAYNILGSAEDAKDAVQDVLYNFLSVPGKEVDNEKGYLIKSVINQSINIKNKKKKIQYGDEWLPEPVATEEADKDIRLDDIAAYSLMILLEKLSPKERAVFILKEGFGYAHEEIAEVLSGTVESSRQLLSRARRKLDTDKNTSLLHPEKSGELLLQHFMEAVRGRDMHALESLLAEDVQYSADGGGKINVVSSSCKGVKEVAALYVLVYFRYLATASIVPTVINHQPAFLYYRKGRLFLCQVFSISPLDGKIFQINHILDPAKLKGLAS